MINTIMYGFTNKLHDVFGYTVYTNKVKQFFEESCFFVKQLNTERTQELGPRSKRNNFFVAQFFPSEGYEQMNEVAQRFLDELDLITLEDGSTVHGYNMRTEIQDDVLYCFVNYNVILTKERVIADSMEDIDIGAKV